MTCPCRRSCLMSCYVLAISLVKSSGLSFSLLPAHHWQRSVVSYFYAKCHYNQCIYNNNNSNNNLILCWTVMLLLARSLSTVFLTYGKLYSFPGDRHDHVAVLQTGGNWQHNILLLCAQGELWLLFLFPDLIFSHFNSFINL